MTKESRVIVRLVALWIIFLGSLYFMLWSAQSLVVSIARAVNNGYENYAGSYSYGGGYGLSPYCIPMPVYPPSSSGLGYEQSAEDKAAFDKYNKEQEEYNSQLEVKCKEDAEKQKQLQEAQAKSSATSDIASAGVLVGIELLAAIGAMVMIKKSEGVE